MKTFNFIEFDYGFNTVNLEKNEEILLEIASLNLKAFNDRVRQNSDLVLRFNNNELKTKNPIDDSNGKLQVEKLIYNIHRFANFYIEKEQKKTNDEIFMDIMDIQISNSFREIREEVGFSLMRLHTNFVLYYLNYTPLGIFSEKNEIIFKIRINNLLNELCPELYIKISANQLQ